MKSNISNDETASVNGEEAFVDNYLLYIMAQASDAVSRTFHQQLATQGVSVPKWRILASLYPGKALNVGELAKKCLMKQPTLTRQVDRLCAEGLTERTHENRDRRGVLVSLTAAGKRQARKYVAMAREHEKVMLQGYSAEETETLKSILKHLTDSTRNKG